jgi:hypothetical protein
MSQPSLHSDLDQSATPTAKRPNASALTNQSNGTAKQAVRIIVESGLIYTTMTVITFLLFVANTAVVYAAIDVVSPYACFLLVTATHRHVVSWCKLPESHSISCFFETALTTTSPSRRIRYRT